MTLFVNEKPVICLVTWAILQVVQETVVGEVKNHTFDMYASIG